MPLLKFDLMEGRDQQAIQKLLDASHLAPHQGSDELNTRRGASPADAPLDPLNPDAAEMQDGGASFERLH
jgi:hypothetical protein